MLEAPQGTRVQKSAAPRRFSGAPALRRDLSEDFETPDDGEEYVSKRSRSGVRLRLNGGLLRTNAGRGIAAGAVVVALAAAVGSVFGVRHYLLHNQRFVIQNSASVQIIGNSHLTRPQLLSIFGEDVDRNILTVSLADRRAELEQLPWVEHATVMRLLPDKLRVSIVERTPVAFVRQGGHIGLVDRSGVLLDMSVDDEQTTQRAHYSFPVVTGLSADDPESTRSARMRLYTSFTADLDSEGKKLSDKLSEVDVSNPEDVKALIPEGPVDILVHFGDHDFLDRYKKFEENLPKWRVDYPKLASADMRYERQVVLEMQKGADVPVKSADASTADAPKPADKPAKPAAKTVASAKAKPTPKKPVAKALAAKAPVKAAPANAHLQTAFDVKKHTQAGPQ